MLTKIKSAYSVDIFVNIIDILAVAGLAVAVTRDV